MALEDEGPKPTPETCDQIPDPKAKDDCKSKHTASFQKTKNPSLPSKLAVRIIYLPGDEYAVTTSRGAFGTFKGSIQLSNGWMLTGINQESDAKAAETITAVATLVSKILPTGVAVAGTEEINGPHVNVPVFLMFEIDTKNNKLQLVDQPGCMISALNKLKDKQFKIPVECSAP